MCLSKADFFTSPISLLTSKLLNCFCLLPFRIYLYICLLLVCTYTLTWFIYLLFNNLPAFPVFINAYTIPHISSLLFTQLISFFYSPFFYLTFSPLRPTALQSFPNMPDSFIILFNPYISIHIFIYLLTKNFFRIMFFFFRFFNINICFN
jgi:hypothetical protein